MHGKVFIHATNTHQGGGRFLLAALLKALAGSPGAVALLDSRMPLDEEVEREIEVRRIRPSVMARFGAERWLVNEVSKRDTVLCFGNLPPLFRLRGCVVVFVQNRYLIDDIHLGGLPLWVQLRLVLERGWLSVRMSNANMFVVQTPTMKSLLEKKVQGRVPVRILPFVAEPNGYAHGAPQMKKPRENEHDFIYVASGEPHKNHRRLIQAWCLLAAEGLFPSLCLTLNAIRFADLCDEIETQRQRHGLRVRNAGELPHQNVLSLYKKAGAAIYPSTFESFGLPLIEARQAGLHILASELDYVRDVINPEQTFDPNSAVSIARAVKRFMAVDETALPLLDAKEFLNKVAGKEG
ncbi:MAG: glycosyltransferase [Methylomicrobium sp.]|nr:glycosyltransferase [Methylomicrobium sp.]